MSALDGLYQELILDHSKRPIGREEFEAPEGTFSAAHHEYNPSCGDELTMKIAVDPETGTIAQLGWEGQGCSISMASASVLSQLVREGVEGDGPLTMPQAQQKIDAFREMIHSRGEAEPDEDELGDAVAFQGVSKFVMRVKCAMLGWVALEADLRQIEAQR